MKMIAWNCQGAGSVTFRNHAYELHCRHRPNILIIIEPTLQKQGLKRLSTLFLTITLDEWILLASLEVFGYYGMKAFLQSGNSYP